MKNVLLLSIVFFIIITTGNISAQDRSTGEVVLRNDNVARITVQLDIDTEQSEVTMTFIGPEDRWYGVGFDVGSSRMVPGKDCVYISEGQLVDALIIGSQPPAIDAVNNWAVASNTTDNGQRTVIATRLLDTGDMDDYVFPSDLESLGLIYAHGRTAGATEINSHRAAANAGAATANFEVLNTKDLEASSLSIFPNPVQNQLNLRFKKATSGTLFIVDYLGKTVKTETWKNTETQTISTNSLTSGIYLARLETAEGQIAKKFVKL